MLKSLSKSGEICSTVRKPALTVEAVAKLYEVGELVDASSLDPKKLQQTAWFFTLLWSRRARKPAAADKIKPEIFQIPEFGPGIL